MNDLKIYNTPVEVGVRMLMIIKSWGREIDLESLIVLEYLSIHANLVGEELKSIHPDNPLHGLEILSKKKVGKEAIDLLILKGLIEVNFSENGISYSSNIISDYFLSFFDGEYYTTLDYNIINVVKRFKTYDEMALKNYVIMNLEKWNGNKF